MPMGFSAYGAVNRAEDRWKYSLITHLTVSAYAIYHHLHPSTLLLRLSRHDGKTVQIPLVIPVLSIADKNALRTEIMGEHILPAHLVTHLCAILAELQVE